MDVSLALNLLILFQLAILVVADVLILYAGARALRQLDELWRNYPQETLAKYGLREKIEEMERMIRQQMRLLEFIGRKVGE